MRHTTPNAIIEASVDRQAIGELVSVGALTAFLGFICYVALRSFVG